MKFNLILFVITLSLPLFCISKENNPDRILVTVKRNYPAANSEKARLAFDWHELIKRLPSLSVSNIMVTDQHFGQNVPVQPTDTDADGKPDKVIFDYTFKSNEPIFTFMVSTAAKDAKPIVTETIPDDGRLVINYLVPFTEEASNGQANSISKKIVESTLNAYPDPKDLSIISPGKWTYEYGFFLNGTYQLWEQTKNERYINYIKQWMNNFITNEGQWKEGVYNQKEYRLDDVLPGRLCIWLYQTTGEEKYKKIADQFIVQLKNQPKTSEGGYWHKEIYPNQMWLDGIYMGDIFSMQYAAAFHERHWYDEAAKQINLIYKHAYDPATGLLFHGWDESKNKVWADSERGTSPELWGRAIGWYAMALIECLDYLPVDHPERKNIESIFQKLCGSIKNFQDKRTSLWFQVINKGNLKDNWIETSSSAMFTYAFAKGFHKNLLDKSYLDASVQAYAALLKNYVYSDTQGNIHLDQTVKVGSLNMKNSKGDYAYYVSCERRLDDHKGLAALLYASMELKK